MLANNALNTFSLEYVAFLCPYDTVHFLTNFEYWSKAIQFEQRFRARRKAALLVSWHFVDIFGTSTRNREESIVRVPSW